MKKVFDRIASYLTKSPTRFFFVAAIAAFFVLWFVNAYSDPDGFSWHDVIVESHGVLFDLLVFGILLSVYEALREKKDKIERLHEEIDDYRGWDEKEATYRIVGSIKRLNRLKINKIDISYCYLRNANLEKVNLQQANLEDTNLENANLRGAKLQKAKLNGVRFKGAILQGVNFEKASLLCADLRNTNLQEVNFSSAELFYANFQGADLQETNFEGANLENTNFEEANLERINFISLDTDQESIINLGLKGANFKGANLKGANFKKANLNGVNLLEAIIPKDWFKKLKAWQVIGREAIIEKYYIDENNRLQLRH